MKKFILSLSIITLVVTLIASCRKFDIDNVKSFQSLNSLDPVRYRDSVFSSVDTTTFFNVLYRIAPNWDITEELKLDVYLPAGDTANNRAAIIFMHGGAFLRQIPAEQPYPASGTRKDSSVVRMCKAYAKRGYVAISVSYRRGIDSNTVTRSAALDKFYQAVYRACQDVRAALRFVKKNAATGKIDTNKIFIGGISAGAVTAMNTAYLDQIETGDVFNSTWGPLDGTGIYDYPGYSNKVKGLVNLEGAITDTTYIDAGNCPLISAFGSLDAYYSGPGPTSAYPYIPFHNGLLINQRLNNVGIVTTPIVVHSGQNHGVSGLVQYLNINVEATSEWMYNLLQ